MTNICMIAKDRPRLTAQAVLSLRDNTPADMYNLTIIDDGGDTPMYREFNGANVASVRLPKSKGIVGFVRNLSIQVSEAYWGRGDYLYLSDNDVFFHPKWILRMIAAFKACESQGLRVLGGVRHPYHGINSRLTNAGVQSVVLTDAVAGYSHLMRWETFDKYGPFDAHAQGVCQSEDFAFCQKIIQDGGKVGYLEVGCLYNCGLTNSEGKPAVGSEAFPRYEGILQE